MKQVIPATSPDFDTRRVVERPDGFYWQDAGSDRLFGPFPTLLDAVNDMEYSADAGLEPAETVSEAGDEIGIADWVDPETGDPAEERVPRIEEH